MPQTILKWLGASLGLLVLSVGVSLNGLAEQQGPRVVRNRPNILIIVTDDQRDDLTVMPTVRKWLGKGGTRFLNAYATTPLCCPARASIMTGQYAHNHGVTTNSGNAWRNLNAHQTIQHYLNRSGYRTALLGKYFNDFPLEEKPADFDSFRFICCTPDDKSEMYFGGTWSINGRIAVVNRYSTDYIAAHAANFIKDNANRAWFLYIGTPAPHDPAIPSPRYESAPVSPWRVTPARPENDRTDKPPYVREEVFEEKRMREKRQNQLRTLMSVDDMVARLARTLKSTHQSRKTLVVFVSDNGYHWGEHGLHGKPHAYRESIGVPLLIRWPDHVRAGKIDRRLAANIDIAPTVLDAARLTPDVPMDGRSLLDPGRRQRLLLENLKCPVHRVPCWNSEVTRTAHYVEYYGIENSRFREFYDWTKDPYEIDNLFARGEPPEGIWLAEKVLTDKTCSGESCP